VVTVTLEREPLPDDSVGLLEGIASTRSIRLYRDDPVPPEALRAILFAASRAPNGSNHQPFRFLVLTTGPKAAEAKRLIGQSARQMWESKSRTDGFDRGSGGIHNSPKARLARTMQHYVDNLERVPVIVLPCLVRYREPAALEGASVYPACQNILLAARALGYGGVMTGWHRGVERELRDLLGVPDSAWVAATITLGRPRGRHGPVRRRPLQELVFEDSWGEAPEWAVDPPGVHHAAAGPRS
jgi:nitroreductase